jgi:GDP-L-fucose synthase
MRDFIHIEDCVTGIIKTMDRIDDAGAINLATGLYTSFIDFAKIAAELCGFRPEVKGTSDKPEGVFARAGDPAKLNRLGFKHTIDFRSGVERALQLYSKT